jgi:parvulin-like peptidyl-prolyl isomerase
MITVNTEVTDADVLEHIKLSGKIPELTEQIMVRRIIQKEAEKAEIRLEVNELQAAADDFRARNGLTSAKSTQMWLSINQLSLDEFENMMRLELLSNKLKGIVLADQVEKYFYQHQLEFDRVALAEVILENKELAMELYYAVREGEIKFHDIAGQYIQDVDLRRKGGYLGERQRKDLSPEMFSVFSVANPPQIIKPIASAQGFRLLWVEEIIKAELNEEIYGEIKNQLFMEYIRNKIKEYSLSLTPAVGQ